MKHQEKLAATAMRSSGSSYSEISKQLGVSKSTLSLWLKNRPLSKDRIYELQGGSQSRITKFQETMKAKKSERLARVYKNVAEDIKILSKREIFIAGLFLYWGEGTKTATAATVLSNTDPAMSKFFILWLSHLGVPKEKVRVRIHLYEDMNVEAEEEYWSKTLKIPRTQFWKSYVKASKRSALSYDQKFTHGTCNVSVNGIDISNYVLMSLKYLRNQFAEESSV